MADIAWWQQGLLQLASTATGGVIGVLATVYQMKYTIQTKMAEKTAERKVDTNQEAYTRMKIIASMLGRSTDEETYAAMMTHEEWFVERRLFLPGRFPNKWLGVRNGLEQAIKMAERPGHNPKTLTGLRQNLSSIAGDAINEIYKEMKLEKLHPDNPGEPVLTVEEYEKTLGR